MKTDIIRPAKYNGVALKDYGVDRNTGDIYSFKRGGCRKLTPGPRNPKNSTDSYMCVQFIDKEAFPNHSRYSLTIDVHVIVQETLRDCPKPPAITDDIWSKTDQTVKDICRGLWMVNHIDHKKKNFNPTNLEWVFGAVENAQKAKAFYSR